MDDRAAFLAAIAATAWDDELPRLVFADWLDERGEHEEADRQRKWVPAERWLREFMVEVGNGPYTDGDYRWRGFTYEDMIEAGHRNLQSRFGEGGITLPFDTPDVVYESGKEFWTNWSIVTGTPVPDDKRRAAPFSCSC